MHITLNLGREILQVTQLRNFDFSGNRYSENGILLNTFYYLYFKSYFINQVQKIPTKINLVTLRFVNSTQ